MNRKCAALAAMATLAPMPLAADPASDDVHCVIAALQAIATNDPALRVGGLLAQVYFMGKLAGQAPSPDIETSIAQELPKMTGPDGPAEFNRCFAEVKAVSDAEHTIDDGLKQKGVTIPETLK